MKLGLADTLGATGSGVLGVRGGGGGPVTHGSRLSWPHKTREIFLQSENPIGFSETVVTDPKAPHNSQLVLHFALLWIKHQAPP